MELLSQVATGAMLSPSQQQQLEAWELKDHPRAAAFGITPANVSQGVQQRSLLLAQIYPAVKQLWQDLGIKTPCLELLWHLWLPLAQQLASERQQLSRPLVQGILGGQGSGKTTLCKVLVLILDCLGYPTLSLSLDDLYKTYAERQQLQQQDPRLIWRGPPGTHDIDLGIQTLDQLRNPDSGPILVPRFDKSAYGGGGDRTQPEQVEGIEIILFEGWFVGLRPIDPALFSESSRPLTSIKDHAFAQENNRRLQAYLSLWNRLDRLIVLQPQDYRLSQVWRQEAEQQVITAGKSGMSDAEINQFVEFFWQALPPDLFLLPLIQDSCWVDLVVEINQAHLPRVIYRPGNDPAGALEI